MYSNLCDDIKMSQDKRVWITLSSFLVVSFLIYFILGLVSFELSFGLVGLHELILIYPNCMLQVYFLSIASNLDYQVNN